MTLTRTCLAVGVALCLAPAALAGSAELAWIGEIPGLKADLTKSGQTSQGIYTVTGDPTAVFDKLQQGHEEGREPGRRQCERSPRGSTCGRRTDGLGASCRRGELRATRTLDRRILSEDRLVQLT